MSLVQVGKLMQQAARLEDVRAEMSKDMEERLTRLSRKHEQELTACSAKHEQVTIAEPDFTWYHF